jgi:hypothetical protein
MPLYEYHCPSCRQTFELLRKAGRVLSLVANLPRDTGASATGGGCPGCAGGACSCAG